MLAYAHTHTHTRINTVKKRIYINRTPSPWQAICSCWLSESLPCFFNPLQHTIFCLALNMPFLPHPPPPSFSLYSTLTAPPFNLSPSPLHLHALPSQTCRTLHPHRPLVTLSRHTHSLLSDTATTPTPQQYARSFRIYQGKGGRRRETEVGIVEGEEELRRRWSEEGSGRGMC